jgi:hypothetical protein
MLVRTDRNTRADTADVEQIGVEYQHGIAGQTLASAAERGPRGVR